MWGRKRAEQRAVNKSVGAHRDELARVINGLVRDGIGVWFFDARPATFGLEMLRVAVMTTPDGRHFVQADLPLGEDELCALAAVFRAQQVAAGEDPWFADDPVPLQYTGTSWSTREWKHLGPGEPPRGMLRERVLTI